MRMSKKAPNMKQMEDNVNGPKSRGGQARGGQQKNFDTQNTNKPGQKSSMQSSYVDEQEIDDLISSKILLNAKGGKKSEVKLTGFKRVDSIIMEEPIKQKVETPKVVQKVQIPKDVTPPKVIPKVEPPKDVTPPKVIAKVEPPKDVTPPKVIAKVQPPKDVTPPKVIAKVEPPKPEPPQVIPKVEPPKDITPPKVIAKVEPPKPEPPKAVSPPRPKKVESHKDVTPPKVVPKPEPPKVIPKPEIPKVIPKAEPPKEVTPRKVETKPKSEIIDTEEEIVEKEYVKPQFVRKPNLAVKFQQLDIDDLDSRIRNYSPVNPQESSRKDLVNLFEGQLSQYKDNIFPPDLSVLLNRPCKQQENPKYENFKNWGPVKQIYPKGKFSIYKFVDPNDIQEGSQLCRNTNVLSSLSALAENPEHIQYLLENQTINQNGMYYVKINKSGVWRFVLIDDFFPFVKDTQQLVITGPRLQNPAQQQEIELWPSLIEKALIKSYGTYDDLRHHDTPIQDILKDLTGGAVLTYDTNDINIEELISSSLKEQCIVMALQDENSGNENFRKGFKFSILNSEKGTIDIRNPWGFEQEPTQFTVQNGGICQIKVPLFKKIFDQIVVVYPQTKQTYYSTRSVDKKNKSYSINKITFEEHIHECFFQFTQVDKRMLKQNKDYTYSQGKLILFSKEEGYITGLVTENVRSSTLVCKDLKAGEYYLISYIDFQFARIQHGTLSYQGPVKVNIERVPFKSNPMFLNQLYADQLQRKFGNKMPAEQQCLMENEGIILVSVFNKGKQDERVTKDFSNIKNCHIIRKLEQAFRQGQQVQVINGQYKNSTGEVLSATLSGVKILTDEKNEIQVKANDLVLSQAETQTLKIETVLKPCQCKTFLFSVQAGVTLGPKTLKECGFK